MHIFLSGLFFFLAGLEGSKWSIKKIASKKFTQLMVYLDNSIILSFVLGIVITAILQSSSAVSIILISLIEAGGLTLKSAICILFGANIATTITVQIISLPVLNYYPYLLVFALIIIIIGLFINKKVLYLGTSILFFSIVFAGLVMMTDFFKSPEVKQIVLRVLRFSDTNIYLGIIVGMLTTALIQSSSAVTGITVSLAINNLITLKTAIAIALGSNIGTCITAFLASLNAGYISKTLAKGHFIFNLFGVIILIPLFSIFEYVVVNTSNHLVRQIANAHTIFNIFNVLIFFPFLNTFISWIGGDVDGYR